MTSGVYPPLGVDQLIQSHNIGFKLIPLGEDGKTPTIKSTNEVYHNPNYRRLHSVKPTSRILKGMISISMRLISTAKKRSPGLQS